MRCKRGGRSTRRRANRPVEDGFFILAQRIAHLATGAVVSGPLSHREVAAAALRTLLPADLTTGLRLEDAQLLEGTFVDEQLQDRQTDVLLEVPGESSSVWVYVLLEHQSSVDRDMPWRLHRYITRIWSRWKADNDAVGRLPEVIPMVLYHGARRWTGPESLAAMMRSEDERQPMASPLVGLRYVLIDLHAMSEDEVVSQTATAPPSLALTLLHLKALAYTRDLIADLRRWAPLLAALMHRADGLAHANAFFSYTLILHNDWPPEQLAQTLQAVVSEVTEEDVMPHPNPHVEALLERGREQGLEQGREAGANAARIDAVMKLLKVKFPNEAEAARSKVEAATPEQIERVFEQIFTAATIDELLNPT